MSGCSEDNPAEVGPRTLTVDAGGGGDYTTIQAALTAARDEDVVVIEPGTYSGPGNKNLTFRGTSPTVTGAERRDLVVIDCEGDGRGFYIDGGSSPVIENLSVTGGDTLRGGGMYLENSSPTLRNVRFSSNRASYGGGGIYSRNGDPVLENVVFEDNSSTVEGGGMLCLHSDAVLDSVTFRQNQAVSGGGLACIFSDPTLTRCVFWANETVFGAIYCGTSSPMITSCTIVGNNGSAGSGIYCASGSSAEIRRTIIANGQAGEGIVCDGSTPYTTLCCFFGNGTFNEVCGTYTTSMVYEDPLFCDVYYGELTLAADSPCLPENNDWEVLIGAFGQGCDEPTRRDEHGNACTMFRD
jgi:predicted outer membrane repeat protein